MTKRYSVLDIIRGIALINMIIYHALWDLVYIFSVDLQWYKSTGAFIWQQCICCTFILLSGFCSGLGKIKPGRIMSVFVASLLISVITAVFMSENIIMFGILSLIASGMFLTYIIDKVIKNKNPYLGLVICLLLFLITRDINSGYLGFYGVRILDLPKEWYSNLLTAYMGLPYDSFVSNDYFSLMPWFFLYQTGYFLCGVLKRHGMLKYLSFYQNKPIGWIGQHSLAIYLLHQPIIYVVLFIYFKII